MSDLDEFAKATVGPQLRQGEVILSIGWGGCGRRDWKTQRERYFLVGTSQRLFVIASGQSFMYGTPKPENEGMQAFEYAHLQSVASARWLPLVDSLVLTLPDRKVDYNIPSPTIIGAKSVHGHADFSGQYLTWLRRHCETGALRTPEGTYAAANEWYQRPMLVAENDRYLAHRKAVAKAQASIRWPYVLAVLALGVVAVGWIHHKDVTRQIAGTRSTISYLEGRVARGDLYDGIEGSIESNKRSLAVWEGRRVPALLILLGGGAGAAGFIYLGIRLNKKKKAQLAAAPAQPYRATA